VSGFTTRPSRVPDSASRNPAKRARPALAGAVQSPPRGWPKPERTATDLSRSAKDDIMNRKHYTLIGAAVGLATFLALGLLPALLYGGYAGVLLAGGIFGTPLKATFLVRGLIVFGMVMGVVGIGGLFAVGGAVGGAAVSALTGAAPERATVEVKAGA
jgi:hypothetical protein